MENLATTKQINLIKKLQEEKSTVLVSDFENLSKFDASRIIGKLIYKTKTPEEKQAKEETPKVAKSESLILKQDSKIFEDYIAEYAKVNKYSMNSDMISWKRKHTSAVIRLSTGNFYVIDKKIIETNFCFGAGWCGISTAEEDARAEKMANHARTNESYFINENLAFFDKNIESFEEKLPIVAINWNHSKEVDHIMTKLDFENDEFRAPYRYEKAQVIDLTEEDRENIIALWISEKAKMQKRLDTYLKKYGLSKLNVWTYLAD